MRYISKVNLTGLAFHSVDGKKQEIILSERLMELDGREKFLDYISSHITNSLAAPSAKAASFLNYSQDLGGIAQKILNNSTDLLNGSQDIARRLYEILKKDKRISPGVLAVCLFEDHELVNNSETESNLNNYLGILKLDPANGFKPQIIKKEGITTVDVEIVDDILPSAKQSLQKCAFIRHHDSESSYDLLALDKQTGGAGNISDFFSHKFLMIKEAFDSKTCTEDFYQGFIEVEHQLRSHLDAVGCQSISRARDAALTSKTVDIDYLLDNLTIPDEHIKTAKKIMANFVHNRSFDVDQQVANKLRKKKKYKGDYGVELKFDAKHEDKIDLKVTYESDSPYAKVSFRVKNWEQKVK